MSSSNVPVAAKPKVINFEVESSQDFTYRKGLASRIRHFKASNPTESPQKSEDLKRLINFVIEHKDSFIDSNGNPL
jgi:hypothetical protein